MPELLGSSYCLFVSLTLSTFSSAWDGNFCSSHNIFNLCRHVFTSILTDCGKLTSICVCLCLFYQLYRVTSKISLPFSPDTQNSQNAFCPILHTAGINFLYWKVWKEHEECTNSLDFFRFSHCYHFHNARHNPNTQEPFLLPPKYCCIWVNSPVLL